MKILRTANLGANFTGSYKKRVYDLGLNILKLFNILRKFPFLDTTILFQSYLEWYCYLLMFAVISRIIL